MSKDRNSQSAVRTFNFVDLFSGVGGITLGFRDGTLFPQVAFVPKLMIDIDPTAEHVVRRNMPDVPFMLADIHRVSGPEILKRVALAKGERIDVVVGGPPCQGLSGLGKRALADRRNAHILDFLRIVRELRPSVAIMENVPQAITSHGGAVINEVCESLANEGYSCCADILYASDYGVPQLRKRAFVLAYHCDLGIAPEFPKRSHERISVASELLVTERRERFEADKLPFVSVEDAIGDLPGLAAGEGDEVAFYSVSTKSEYQTWAREGAVAVFNHKARTHSKEFLRKISVIAEGGRNMDLPKKERFSDNYYSQAYARLHRNGIAQTITTHFGNPGSGRFTHFRDLRSITVREAARFQSFPDSFVFHGELVAQMRHVGNAVPPLLARALRDQVGRDLLSSSRAVAAPARAVAVQIEIPDVRSRTMRAVGSKNTSSELKLRSALSAAGVRGYRLHSKSVPGSPDVVFGAYKLAIFVDGCFWHGCSQCYRAEVK